MLLATIQFIALGSLALATPLKLRGQNVVTVTATTTVTLGGSPSASASAASGPSSPPEQCKEFCKTDKISYETCLSNCQVIDGQVQVNAPGVLFPPNGGASSTAKVVPEQCKEFCKTDKISYDTCLSNCQVIDGQVQVNAPGVLFPPNREASSTSSVAPEQCKEFCKTDKISYDTCLSNCQVIDGNVQVNAPGVLFPPAPSSSSSSTTTTTTTFTTSTTKPANPPVPRATAETAPPASETLDQAQEKCEAACDRKGQNYGNCMETCAARRQIASEMGVR